MKILLFYIRGLLYGDAKCMHFKRDSKNIHALYRKKKMPSNKFFIPPPYFLSGTEKPTEIVDFC